VDALKVRFQADADLNEEIVAGLFRREPEIDFQTAQDANLSGLPDQEVLAIAAREGRILITHDRRTMPYHFGDFIANETSPGVIVIAQNVSVRDAIEELLLIWTASDTEYWLNRIASLPL